MIAASIVASRALAPIEGTIEGWRNFVQARTAYARIKTLLQSSPLNFDRLRLPRPQGLLSVERVLYVPPPNKQVILNGMTFQLNPGELLAIVGASGTGKSTLGRMLVGSIFPTAGNDPPRHDGPAQLGPAAVRRERRLPAAGRAALSGDNQGQHRSHARGCHATRRSSPPPSWPTSTRWSRTSPHGYETPITIDGSPLSGGQKQRIGLARAFFGNPRAGRARRTELQSRCQRRAGAGPALLRAKKKGITVVAITQRPALLSSVDKIMVLNNGTVQALGKRDEILPMISGKTGKTGDAGAVLDRLEVKRRGM